MECKTAVLEGSELLIPPEERSRYRGDQGMAQMMLVSESLADRGLVDYVNKVTFYKDSTF